MEKPAIEGGRPVRETPIYYGHQYIDEADIQAVVDVMKSDYLTCGPKIAELEKKLRALTGAIFMRGGSPYRMRWSAPMVRRRCIWRRLPQV